MIEVLIGASILYFAMLLYMLLGEEKDERI